MAKLVLNRNDKDQIIEAIKRFVIKRYYGSRLGEERAKMIEEIQVVATREFFKMIPPSDLVVLKKHGCVKNSTQEDMRWACVICRNSHPEESRKYLLELDCLAQQLFYSKNEFASFKLKLPYISSSTHEVYPCKDAVNSIERIVNGDMTKNSMAGQLFEICDIMWCEVSAILPGYSDMVRRARNWESLAELAPEIEKMVNPDMIEDLRNEKEGALKKKCETRVADRYSVLFGKEVLEEDASVAKKE